MDWLYDWIGTFFLVASSGIALIVTSVVLGGTVIWEFVLRHMPSNKKLASDHDAPYSWRKVGGFVIIWAMSLAYLLYFYFIKLPGIPF